MAFTQKLLDVKIELGTVDPSTGELKTFAPGANTVTLSGLRTSAKIVKAAFPGMNVLDLRVYGMSKSDMNAAAVQSSGLQINGVNRVTVLSGEAPDAAKTIAFFGTIKNAWGDYNASPDVAFRVEAFAGLLEATDVIPPSSFQSSVNVADVMANLAKQANLSFENNGVSVILPPGSAHSGSSRDQMMAFAEDAGIEASIDDGTLAIWPRGKQRQGETVEISPITGLVGYPTFTPFGIILRTVYMPALRLGGRIHVTNAKDEHGVSVLLGADGDWIVQRLDQDLESLTPYGEWFSTLYCMRPGLVTS